MWGRTFRHLNNWGAFAGSCVVCLAAACWFTSCRNSADDMLEAPDPGAEQYRKAMKEFYRLEGETLDPGYSDKGFDRVIEMLEKVPFGSTKWKAAQDTIQSIRKARAKAEKDRQEVSRTLEILSGLKKDEVVANRDTRQRKSLGQSELEEAKKRVENVRKHIELRRKEILKYCGNEYLHGRGIENRRTKLYQCASRLKYYKELESRLVDEEKKLRVLERRAGQ